MEDSQNKKNVLISFLYKAIWQWEFYLALVAFYLSDVFVQGHYDSKGVPNTPDKGWAYFALGLLAVALGVHSTLKANAKNSTKLK